MPFITDDELNQIQEITTRMGEKVKTLSEAVEQARRETDKLLRVKDEQIERLSTMVRESHRTIRELLEPKRQIEHGEDY